MSKQASEEIRSIRIGSKHWEPSLQQPVEFRTINKAKKFSRELGGAGSVRVARTLDHAREILREMGFDVLLDTDVQS